MRTITTYFVLIWACLRFTAESVAQDPIRQGMDIAAKKIAAVMQQQGFKSATIQPVIDETTLDSPGLAGFAKMLADGLKSQHVTLLDKQGDIGIALSLSAAKEQFTDRFLRLKFKLRNKFGDEIPGLDGDFLVPQGSGKNFIDPNTFVGKDGELKQRIARFERGQLPHDINSPSASLIAFGLNGSVANDGENGPMERLMQHPHAVIVGDNTAKMSEISPLAVRIIGPNGPKNLRMVANQPFVDFEPDEKFSIQIINEGPGLVAATVTVDGLNSFYSSLTPAEHGTSWIIPGMRRNQSLTSLLIEGWYKRRGVADKFVATTYEQSRRKEAGLGEAPTGGFTIVFNDVMKKSEQMAPNSLEEPKTFDTAGSIVPREGGGFAIVKLNNGILESVANIEKTYTRQVPLTKTVEQTYTVNVPIYIGGAGDVEQQEGSPSDYVPRESAVIGAITIRYRHPKA